MKKTLGALALAIMASACGGKAAPKSDPTPTGTVEKVPAPVAATAAGNKAVDGQLIGIDGAPVQLASVWSKKPTIVVFYRGFF
jgi:hypothetical protein